jgi:hypothetical protein
VDGIQLLANCWILRTGAQSPLIRKSLELLHTMPALRTNKNRLLPGWIRMVLIVWGIALLLLVLQYGSLALFASFFG